MEGERLIFCGLCIDVEGMTSFDLIFPQMMVTDVAFGITRHFNAKAAEGSGSPTLTLQESKLSYF